MQGVQWYVRGYKTMEELTNKVKVGKFTNKMSPSDFNRRVNCLTINLKTGNGMNIFEASCTDPLAIVTAFSQIKMSICPGNKNSQQCNNHTDLITFGY